MTFVSYAQNFEDVLLWRALKRVGAGFYIDVGAAHPDIDSVTRALYDNGWSGVNIEPVEASARRLRAARPRDVTLAIALGETAGRSDFFVVAGSGDTGLSTLVGEAGEGYRERFDVVRTEVEVETLAEVCRRHATGPIHVLKVDVEGAERAVLAGADFAAFRPWVVLVEATVPMSTVPTHGEWEGILLAAGYRFVWFDGLNRFYVAEEKAAELAGHFRTPPNVFDDFVRAGDTDWARRIGQAEALRTEAAGRAAEAEERGERLALRLAKDAALTAELDRLLHERSGERDMLRERLHEAQAGLSASAGREDVLADQVRLQAERAAALERQVETMRHRAEAFERRAAALDAGMREARFWLELTRGSTSWKVTAPVRRAVSLVRRVPEPPIPAEPVLEAFVPAPPSPPPAVPALVFTHSPDPPAPPLERAYTGPLRAVHQFHSGSATGDAVTAAMLLTRDLLRGAGYRSHIYVEHLDPALAHELRPLDEMPLHAEYVLIVRHSMGHGVLERLLRLPAPKVLHYHNITPAALLEDPFLREAARTGRRQLEQLRPHVAAALADSEYNAMELRALGFDPVSVCTLLLDPERPAAPVVDTGRPFTVLFVGRIIESKNQLGLIEAFARFVHPFGGPARLVLVGRHGGEADSYLQHVFAAIRRHGLDAAVTVTGPLSDAERDGWYGSADLYVSLSRHEGFGVPLVEAMLHGVPVLAWPAGAVAETLGGAGELLDDPSPSAVGARMLALARDRVRRVAMAEAGRRGVERFRPARNLPRMIEALVRAGAAPPASGQGRAALAARLRFAVTGHVLGSYSLAAVNRGLAATIEAARPGRVRVLPVEGAPIDDLSRVAAGERPALARLAGRVAPETGPEVVISQHYPVYVPPDGGDLLLALLFWEESVLPAATVAELARFRGVLAPSRFVAKLLVDAGVDGPVRWVGQAPRLAPFFALPGPAARDGRAVSFLHVSSCFPRKGVDVLLAAWGRAFRRGDAVELVIKGHANPHNDVPEQVARLGPEVAPVRYVGDELDEAGLLALYRAADAMVLPTRGEGYNLPAAEALAAGVPLIVTGFGGHLDFCGAEEACLLPFAFAPSGSHLATPGSVWAEPDEDALVVALREVARDPGPSLARAARGRARILQEADPGALVARLEGVALDLLTAPPAEPVRLAWVSTWGVRCGIAEYSRHLLGHMELAAFGRVSVLADLREPEEANVPDVAVRRVWRAAAPVTAEHIAMALAAEDPHVAVVQHQPGLIGWALLEELLHDPRIAGQMAVVVALHNTRHLDEVSAEERATALRGLRSAARVLVHGVGDLNRLRRLGLVENVTLLPHGTQVARAGRAVRSVGPDDEVLLGCYGFLLPGKGIPELVEALAILRRTRPGVRLRLVNALYPSPLSEAEWERCRGAIGAAGLGNAVEVVTAFLPHERSVELLSECDLVVLPYQESMEASSAAARTAVAAGVPVAVTPLPLFDEAGEAVVRLPGTGPACLAAGIEALLADPAARAAAVMAAAAWAEGRSWERVGTRLGGMLRGLEKSRDLGGMA